jgi:predicted dehydrogenase
VSTCSWRSRSQLASQKPKSFSLLADKQGIVLMVGHIERFNPAAQAIAAAVDPTSIVAITLTRAGPKREKIRDVGVILDLCIHDIDLVRWLTQSEIVEHQVMVAGRARGPCVPSAAHCLGCSRKHPRRLAELRKGAHARGEDQGSRNHWRPPPPDRH